MSIEFKCQHCGKKVQAPGDGDCSAFGKYKQSIISGVACLILGVTASCFFFGLNPQSWQSTGDGKTISSPKSDELKFTHSGELAHEVAAREKKTKEEETGLPQNQVPGEQVKQQENPGELQTKKTKDQRKDKDDLIEPWLLVIREKGKEEVLSRLSLMETYTIAELMILIEEAIFYAAGDEAKEQIVSRITVVIKENEQVFLELKRFANTETEIAGEILAGSWERQTRSLRLGESISEKEKLTLINTLAKLSLEFEQPQRETCEDIIRLLKKYDTSPLTEETTLGWRRATNTPWPPTPDTKKTSGLSPGFVPDDSAK